MPFPGILETLSPEQSDQLLTWIEIHPIQTVLERVAAPPPDGFGMKTHVTSLRRFYRRAQSRLIEEEAREAGPSPVATQDAAAIEHAAVGAMTFHAFQAASCPALSRKDMLGAARWLRGLRAHQLELEKIQLARERLAFDRQRLQMLVALKEAASETDYEEDKIQAAVASIIRGENPPPVPRTTEFLTKEINAFEPH